MNRYDIIEAIISIFIISLIALAANVTLFQAIRITGQSNSHMTTLLQIENASYWISCDAQSSDNVTTDNLGGNDFLVLSWTEVATSENTTDTDHLVTYYFDGLSGGIGELRRNHISSNGLNNDTLVAQYMYYDVNDPTNSCYVSYASPALKIKLTAIRGDSTENREYSIVGRPSI